MPELKWDQDGQHLYETGVKKVVLYRKGTSGYEPGVAWNGVTSISENPTGAESNPIYADDTKYLDIRSKEDLEGSIEAYTYPDEWEACDGSGELAPGVKIGQQTRMPFALCYRTVIGNDEKFNDYNYKLHIIYNATASPSERQYQTVNDSPEAINFSWDFTTTPIPVEGKDNTSLLTLDAKKIGKEKMDLIEAKLYGTDSPDGEPTLLTPDEVLDIINAA